MNLTEDITLLTEYVHLVTKDQAWHYRVLPKHKANDHLLLYCDEGADVNGLISELEVLLNQTILLEPIPAAHVSRLLSKIISRTAPRRVRPRCRSTMPTIS